MMDRASNQQSTATPTAPQVPELGHLKAVAERLAYANSNLTGFIVRFFGPMPEGSSATKSEQPVGCYRNDITAVFDQIGQLENAISALANIG